MTAKKLFFVVVVVVSIALFRTEARATEKHEIRDYAWNHLRKEDLIRREPPAWIPQHVVQTDIASGPTGATRFLPLAPALQGSFAGNGVDDFDPPDPILAAGPNHIISAVNTAFNIYNKNGQVVFSHTLKNWFSPHLAESSGALLFDVKTIYDQYAGHYILFCLAVNPHLKRSWVFFSASKTQDPLGDWVFHALDMQLNNQNRTSLFADFPGVGYDEQAVYITANMLNEAGDFRYAKIRVLKKSELYSASTPSWRDYWGMIDATGTAAINVMPAQCFGPTTAEYLMSTNAVRGDKLTLWTIRNGGTSPTISKRSIPVSSYQLPPPAPQKGGGADNNTGDAGVVNVVYSNGSLYAANSVAFDWGAGINAAVRLYQVSTNGVVQQEITYGSKGLYYYYPAVMADARGNVIFVYNRSGIGEFAGIRFTGRKAGDPPGTLQTAATLKLGLANYEDPILDGLNPWGDYNGIALDPDDSVWIFSEFAKTRDAWSTWVGHVRY